MSVAQRDPVGDAEHDHDSDDGGAQVAAPASPPPAPNAASGPVQLGSSVMAALVQMQQG